MGEARLLAEKATHVRQHSSRIKTRRHLIPTLASIPHPHPPPLHRKWAFFFFWIHTWMHSLNSGTVMPIWISGLGGSGTRAPIPAVPAWPGDRASLTFLAHGLELSLGARGRWALAKSTRRHGCLRQGWRGVFINKVQRTNSLLEAR